MFKKENVTKELRMAEANYWSSKLNDSRSGSKEFWNVVKLLTGKSAKSKPVGPVMYEQKELVVDDSAKAAPLTFSFQQLGKNLPNLLHRGRLTFILLFYRITPSIGDLVNLVPRAFPLKNEWGGKRPWHRLVTCPLVHPKILGVIN